MIHSQDHKQKRTISNGFEGFTLADAVQDAMIRDLSRSGL